MISTFQALLATAIAILPGAVYTIARESCGASWAWRKTDAATLIFRFLTASAFFHLLLASISYAACQNVNSSGATTRGALVARKIFLLGGAVQCPHAPAIIRRCSRHRRRAGSGR